MEFQVHGALVEVLGVGVLLRGESSVGKSECALELVQRGHRLVADDVVRLVSHSRSDSAFLMGHSPALIRHYIEIRGIGLLDVHALYGDGAVRDECRIDLICVLEPWRQEVEYERIGLDRPRQVLGTVSLPCLTLPVHPARSMATLVEVAVRDHRERVKGVNAAKKLDATMRRQQTALEASGGAE